MGYGVRAVRRLCFFSPHFRPESAEMSGMPAPHAWLQRRTTSLLSHTLKPLFSTGVS